MTTRPFAREARDLCTEEHAPGVECEYCLLLERRLAPISEVIRDMAAAADLTIEFDWRSR